MQRHIPCSSVQVHNPAQPGPTWPNPAPPGAGPEQGRAQDALACYAPRQTWAQVDAQMLAASPLATVGQALHPIQAHQAMAKEGCGFLLVHAPGDAQAVQVAAVARGGKARVAQRYSRFMIAELIGPPSGEAQVFESPDRGLDLPVAAYPRHADSLRSKS